MARNWIVAIILIGSLGLIIFLGRKENDTDWDTKYKYGKYQPFHIDVAKALIEDHFNVEEWKDTLTNLDLKQEKFSYLYIGNMAHDSSTLLQIKELCEAGHEAHLFLDLSSSNFFYNYFYDYHRDKLSEFISHIANDEYELIYFTYNRLNRANVYLDEGNSSQEFDFEYPRGVKSFQYYSLSDIAPENVTVLGYLENLDYYGEESSINYFSIDVGEGKIFFHLSPQFVTNYQIRNIANISYFEDVLSNISTNKVILDRFNTEARAIRNFQNKQKDNPSYNNDGPLSYIFKNEALRFSWYLLITAIALFIMFQAKRKQRIIPVLPKKRNRSLEFIEQSAKLYFKAKNHDKISKTQIAMFNHYIRTEYGLSFSDFKKDKQDQTARKINIPLEYVEKVGNIILYIERLSEVGEKDLIDLNTHLENFYQLSNKK